MDLGTWLDGGRTYNVWSLAIAVLGLLLAIYGLYLTFRSKRDKRPTYFSASYEVISKKRHVDGLEVLFQGSSVPSLTVTRVAFWNGGRETIHRADLVTADPLCIVPKRKVELLAAKLSHVQRAATGVHISPSADSVAIEFDFLDYHDGCIVDIYHAEPSDFEVLGTLKGSPLPVDGRRARRYKADLAMDWFFENMVPKSVRDLQPLLGTLVIFPFYFPVRLASLPFGILEMVLKPLQPESSEPPDGFDLK